MPRPKRSARAAPRETPEPRETEDVAGLPRKIDQFTDDIVGTAKASGAGAHWTWFGLDCRFLGMYYYDIIINDEGGGAKRHATGTPVRQDVQQSRADT